ncbi:hypothetical protein [Vibrio owensii]|uniref:hypothetical protein n=1 Tax=Vibrio owensii TaxID=696485 RepID=UPI003CC635F7
MNLTEVIKYHTSDTDADNITKKYDSILSKFDSLFEEKPKISSENDYVKCHKAKGLLCALACYTSNTNHMARDKVWERESVYGIAMHKYNKRLLISDSEVRMRARYLLWNYYFQSVSFHRILSDAIADRIIVKHRNENGKITLFVVGLHYKVGDNSFRVDSKGREHRIYVETVGRQAFPISTQDDALESFISANSKLIEDLPELDDTYHETYIGDGKGAARNIAFKHRERDFIISKY